MNPKELAFHIQRIPHLFLGTVFSVDKLLQEYKAIDPVLFTPYQSPVKHERERIAKNWHGVSLYSTDGSLDQDTVETLSSQQSIKYKPTTIGLQSPYMLECIQILGGGYSRARIMIVKAGGSLAWHSHVHYGRTPEIAKNHKILYEVVVHIPIITNPDFTYEVVDLKEYQPIEKRLQFVSHVERYYPGEVWMFNNAHMHNVFNRGKTDRVSIMLTLDLRNPITFKIVKKAIDNYRGVLLPPLLQE